VIAKQIAAWSWVEKTVATAETISEIFSMVSGTKTIHEARTSFRGSCAKTTDVFDERKDKQ